MKPFNYSNKLSRQVLYSFILILKENLLCI